MKNMNKISIFIILLMISFAIGCTPKDENNNTKQNNENIWLEDTVIDGIKFSNFNKIGATGEQTVTLTITNTKNAPQMVYSFDIQLYDENDIPVDGFSTAIAREFAAGETDDFTFEANAEDLSLVTRVQVIWEQEAPACGPWCEGLDPTQDFNPSDYQ